MPRSLLVGIALAALASCGKPNEPAAGPEHGASSTDRSGSDLHIADAAQNANPTHQLVTAAFHGKPPVFPQLSKDGSTAIVELDTPVGMSAASTYSIGYIVTANGVPSLVPLVDARLVHLLMEGTDDGASPVIDVEGLSKIASGITNRLAGDGFTAFQNQVDVPAGKPVSAGPLRLQLDPAPGGALTITVTDQAGAPVTAETIQPVVMGTIGSVDCTGVPSPRKVWFDPSRKRALLQIGWTTSARSCETPDDQYRLYAAP
jgi:hypothetical protein